jgi:zinc transporter, ZIP family
MTERGMRTRSARSVNQNKRLNRANGNTSDSSEDMSRSTRGKSKTRSSSRSTRSSSVGKRTEQNVVKIGDDDKAVVAKKRGNNNAENSQDESDVFGYSMLLLVAIITVFCYPPIVNYTTALFWGNTSNTTGPDIFYVFYAGWITAISTGLGALPFCFMSKPNNFYMGASNAIACGMMIAASYSLCSEGWSLDEEVEGWGVNNGIAGAASYVAEIIANLLTTIGIEGYDSDMLDSPLMRTVIGLLLGIVFIIVTQAILSNQDDLHIGNIDGASAQKMVLIVFVMTLHSLTEGIGIGVSFVGKRGMQLGQFISLSLAAHNIPEGLAVALVLTTRGVSNIRAGLWAIFTSLPQPMMAVLAFIFVKEFLPLLPVGLGFAAGAMAYVAMGELFPEAVEEIGYMKSSIIAGISCVAMFVIQEAIHSLTHG